MSYATDGVCHHAEHGTFGHECNKPATWIGAREDGYACGFCDACQPAGARVGFTIWQRIAERCLTPTTHERREWERLAVCAYSRNRRDIGRRYREAAQRLTPMTSAEYDALATPFRRWLIDNTLPEA